MIKSFVQLRYLERYARELDCGCLAIESPYIDRDYIEDHSAFYSKNLFPYPNSCRRVHFFKGDVGVIGQALTDAIRDGEASVLLHIVQPAGNCQVITTLVSRLSSHLTVRQSVAPS